MTRSDFDVRLASDSDRSLHLSDASGNRKTAKALGLTIPLTLLGCAVEVIELAFRNAAIDGREVSLWVIRDRVEPAASRAMSASLRKRPKCCLAANTALPTRAVESRCLLCAPLRSRNGRTYPPPKWPWGASTRSWLSLLRSSALRSHFAKSAAAA
jgi:hypothetical protein